MPWTDNLLLAILTHCNAGALATGGWGTAVGGIHSAFEEGLIKMVYVSTTGEADQQTAKLAASTLDGKVRNNANLRELDYGLWKGRI